MNATDCTIIFLFMEGIVEHDVWIGLGNSFCPIQTEIIYLKSEWSETLTK